MRKWTKKELAYARNNYRQLTNKEMGQHLGCSGWSVWKLKNSMGLRIIKVWTKEEISFLRANAHHGYKWLAEQLNVSLTLIDAAMGRYKIKTGNNTQFKKGFNPWNAGRHQRMSPKSEFKKGMVPANTKFDGAISIRRDSKSTRLYKYIRIARAKWVLLSRHTWQQHYGPVPKGMLISFKDGNQLNCDISNMKLITMRENLRRNMNREKVNASLAELWENGTRYANDEWISKLLARGDKELAQQLLQNKVLIETKRQQLLLRRQLKVKPQNIAAQP